MSELLTIQQAADRYQVSTSTIRRAIRNREIDAQRFGPRLVRIPAEALERRFRPLYPESNDSPRQVFRRVIEILDESTPLPDDLRHRLIERLAGDAA